MEGIEHYGKSKPYIGREDDLQKSCARYLSAIRSKPLFFHPPNGGRRDAREAKKFKSMGVLAGVSDIIILEPAVIEGAAYHGLIIELKAKGGKLQPSQFEFLTRAKERNYFVAVCWNFDTFVHIVQDYLRK